MQNSLIVLGVIMLIMKLADVQPIAGISWWLVLLPFYFWYAVVAIIAIATFTAAAVVFIAASILALFGL